MCKKIKVLLVEDDEDERLFIKEGFLKTDLYEIVGEAENGNEMLQLLKTPSFPRPDVILSDLNMPGRNGYEVIMDIKSQSAFKHIAVIILTTAPEIPYAKQCKKLGACAYYTKPDTFLDYQDFAKQIYSNVKTCLSNTKLDISGFEKLKTIVFQNIIDTCTPLRQYHLGSLQV